MGWIWAQQVHAPLSNEGSEVRTAPLLAVFNSDRKRLLDAHLARLCVLYEDLRIETFAISADSIAKLDVLDPLDENSEDLARVGRYRRNYFLRRSIGTLFEFAEGLRLLNECPDFSLIKADFDAYVRGIWAEATDFFQQNEGLIKEIRNDIGGHFGLPAAQFAVENLNVDAVGKIEVILDEDRRPRDPRLHFAGEIAASAMCKRLPGHDLHEEMGDLIKNRVAEGYRQATMCVQALVALHLWPRFGR
jgi:hypothetical protein